jgi:hypothetical protein
MSSLAEEIPKEQARVRELLAQYKDPLLNGAGTFAAAMMEKSLADTDRAVISGDIAEMIRCYNDLKGYE